MIDPMHVPIDLHVFIENPHEKEMLASNELLEDRVELEIYMGEWNPRKNVALDRVASHVNFYFLQEMICAVTEMDGLWSEKMCGIHATDCPIYKILYRLRPLI